MSYEEEFDKIVRQKAGEAEYPFDENNWLKTSRLLDAERAAPVKSGWKKIYVPSAVIVGGSLILAFVLHSVDRTGNEKIRPVAQAINSAPVEKTEQRDRMAGILQAEIAPAENNVSEITVKTSEAKKIRNEGAGTIVPGGKESSVARSQENVPALASAPGIITGKAKNEPVMAAPGASADIPGPAREEISGQAKENAVKFETPSAKETAASTEENPSAAAPVQNEKPALVQEPGAGEEKKQPEAGVSEAALIVEKEIPAASAITASAESGELLAVDWLQKISAPAYTPLDRDLKFFPCIPLKVYDDYFDKKGITHYLNIEAGGTYLLGWNAANGRDGKGLNWFAGFNYGIYTGKKASVSFGFQLYNITNIMQPFYKGQKKDYGFGYNSSFTSITTDNLCYVAIPLKFNYHLNRSNTLGVGLNGGYLVQAHSRVDSYGIADGIQSQVVSAGNNTVYESAQTLNMMGSLFYNTRLTTRFAINAEFMYGFTDLFKNTAEVSTTEKPAGVRLSVNYFLFRK